MAGVVKPAAAPSVGERVLVRVRSLASSGAGVADLPDGRVAFVQRTAPGDLVEARIVKLRPRWGEARLLEVLEAGPSRLEAPCPLFDRCGGCSLQHLGYDEQLRWKRTFVADAMARIGGLEAPVPAVVPSPRQTGYRNRVTFTVRALAKDRFVAGFHALGNPDRIVDVGTECLLPEPPILEAWAAIRGALRSGALPLQERGELRLTLRSLEAGVVLLVKGGGPGWDPALLLAQVPGLLGVWYHASGERAPVQVAGGPVHEAWGEDRVPMAGQAFLQVNRGAAESLTAFVLAQAGAPARAIDAYCGIGVYGRALARRGWEVEGIELDADACAGARHDAPAGFRVWEGRAEDRLAELLPADLVVLNPPRTGLHEGVLAALTRRLPSTVVYVSCDPATLARDAGRLKEAYRLVDIRSFDLFPQTSHVETVAVLIPRGGK
ncbi:MAG: class I SAM-dependent RNA methyltransferase [Longimicrobiales bacterium]|nr:class I SAM-dependent RNA methyltransferase [Longimicrobiales bacterium]